MAREALQGERLGLLMIHSAGFFDPGAVKALPGRAARHNRRVQPLHAVPRTIAAADDCRPLACSASHQVRQPRQRNPERRRLLLFIKTKDEG